MALELGPKFPFSVDTWSFASRIKKYHFLTHAHKDHTLGIECHGSYPIYCSAVTAKLVLKRHPKLLESIFVELEVQEPALFEHEDELFTVTAYDANHCAGAIMLLFEGPFGNVLHTGDCRLSKDCCSRLPPKWFFCPLDCIFLDCTFGKEDVKMPTKEEAIKQVKQCIWNHPDAPIVYLACDLLGHEILLQCISISFGMKIYVNKTDLPDFFATLSVVVPDLLTEDSSSTRFHVCEGFPKLYERAKHKFKEADVKGLPEPLFIRPSAQWYTYGERLEGAGSGLILHEKLYPKVFTARRKRPRLVPMDAERDPFGVWHVCFSMHSSREELETVLQKLRPKQVVSTSLHCKPIDLGYENVMDNGLMSHLEHGRSKQEAATTVSTVTAVATVSKIEMVLEKVQMEGKTEENVNWDASSIFVRSPRRTIPLFGRAREGLPPSPPLFFDIEEATSPVKGQNSTTTTSATVARERSIPSEETGHLHRVMMDDGEIRWEEGVRPDTESKIGDGEEEEGGESAEFGWWKSSSASSNTMVRCDGERRGVLEESTRIICRSLHMRIPSPLPSLVEMARQLHTNKRSKFNDLSLTL